MKLLNKIKLLYVLVLFSLVILIIISCLNNTEPEQAPPTLPPASNFVMDFSDFISPDTSGLVLYKKSDRSDFLSNQNWKWAATNVYVWNTLLTVGLAVPVASFGEAFRHEPVLQENGKWLWSYNFMVIGAIYTAKLYGFFNTNGVEWEMYISKQNDFIDFLWYTGSSNFKGTEGTWILNKSPEEPDSLLLIVWQRDPVNATGNIKYTNVVPEGPENGGYIYYGLTQNIPYNAFYDIYNKGQNNHANIEWSRTTKEGRVKDPHHFQDSNWHCWDSNLEDVDCQ
jgi:hypothetical protein